MIFIISVSNNKFVGNTNRRLIMMDSSSYNNPSSYSDAVIRVSEDTNIVMENCVIDGGDNVEHNVQVNGSMIADEIYIKSSLSKDAIAIGIYIESLAMLLVDKGVISKEEFEDCMDAFKVGKELTKNETS